MSHNLVTLEKWAFLKDVQMILIPFFDTSNQKSVINKKPIFFPTQYPQIGINYTYLGMTLNKKISFLEITEFWLEISKNDTNII